MHEITKHENGVPRGSLNKMELAPKDGTVIRLYWKQTFNGRLTLYSDLAAWRICSEKTGDGVWNHVSPRGVFVGRMRCKPVGWAPAPSTQKEPAR